MARFKSLQNNPFPFLGGMALNDERATTINLFSAAQTAVRDGKEARFAWIVSDKKLGEGGFGQVFEVFNTSNWAMCAGKRMNFDVEYQKESGLMKRLEHKHIVRYIDVERGYASSAPMIIMEYFHLGDLAKQHKKRSFTQLEIISIVHQVASALVYLRGKGITHRDLKPANILVRSPEPVEVAVADFGVSSENEVMTTCIGTRQYMAPEVYTSDFYDSQADMWFLGLLALSLLPASLPRWENNANWAGYSKRVSDARRKLVGQFENKEFAHEVETLLALYPTDRPSAEELFNALSALAPNRPGASQETGNRSEQLSPEGTSGQAATLRAIRRKTPDTIKPVHIRKSPIAKPSRNSQSSSSRTRPSQRNYEATKYQAELWDMLEAPSSSLQGQTVRQDSVSSVKRSGRAAAQPSRDNHQAGYPNSASPMNTADWEALEITPPTKEK